MEEMRNLILMRREILGKLEVLMAALTLASNESADEEFKRMVEENGTLLQVYKTLTDRLNFLLASIPNLPGEIREEVNRQEELGGSYFKKFRELNEKIGQKLHMMREQLKKSVQSDRIKSAYDNS